MFMYYRTLRIALFGIDEKAAAAIEALEAPKRFTFEFERQPKADLALARKSSVVIASIDALGSMTLEELSAATRDSKCGYSGLVLIVRASDISSWTADDFALVDALWPAPLTPECAAFEFSRVIERAKSDADAYITNAYLNTLIDSMPEMVWFKALDGEHVKVNSYFCGIVDKTREDVTGQFHNYIWSVPEEDWEKAELTCQESDNVAIKAGKTTRCDELVSTHGEIRTFDTYKTPIYDEDGTLLGTSGFAHDVTVERELQHLAWLNARTDYLTGLYNRRYFYEYLEEHKGDMPITFVLVDLDNFKDINDEGGHGKGDNALLVTTAALHKCFPDCPVVRWGGDEFIVVVPHSAQTLADDDNLREFQRTLQEWTSAQCSVALTASIGTAVQEDGLTVDEAVHNADSALYEAKRVGKARFVHYKNL